jgi:hypothetical protein
MTHTMNIIPNHDHGVKGRDGKPKSKKSESNDATTTIHQAVSQVYSSLDSCNKYVLIGVARHHHGYRHSAVNCHVLFSGCIIIISRRHLPFSLSIVVVHGVGCSLVLF